jgi:hypothetical protein
MNYIVNSIKKELSRDRLHGPTLCAFKLKTTIVVLSGVLLIASPIANAALPSDMTVFSQAQELPDEALSHMRGKFVAQGKIMSFGIEMVTQWQSSIGEVIRATGDLRIDLSGQPNVSFIPSITVQQNGSSGSIPTTQGTSIAGGAGGLENVTGVVQNIQVAGRFNGIENNIVLNVRRGATTSQPFAPQGQSTISVQTPNGSSATVSMADNGIGISVVIPDQGQAIQQIRSVAQGGGQVLQSVQLGGDLNNIQNMININVNMNTVAANTNSRLTDVLTNLRGLSQAGLF